MTYVEEIMWSNNRALDNLKEISILVKEFAAEMAVMNQEMELVLESE